MKEKLFNSLQKNDNRSLEFIIFFIYVIKIIFIQITVRYFIYINSNFYPVDGIHEAASNLVHGSYFFFLISLPQNQSHSPLLQSNFVFCTLHCHTCTISELIEWPSMQEYDSCLLI